MKFGQLVIGPAGSGKSTYCYEVNDYIRTILHRSCVVVNLDPGCEELNYDCDIDVRELISVTEAMNELELGPNGGLVFCMEYILDNLDWLEEELSTLADDEYVLFDCPGQLELYTHMSVMRSLCDSLQNWGFRLCVTYCLDSTFITEPSRLIAGSLAALSAMIQLELPHVNLLTKCDLIYDEELGEEENQNNLEDTLENLDPQLMLEKMSKSTPSSFLKLNAALTELLSEYSLVSFTPFNRQDEHTVSHTISIIDQILQIHEELEIKEGGDLIQEP